MEKLYSDIHLEIHNQQLKYTNISSSPFEPLENIPFALDPAAPVSVGVLLSTLAEPRLCPDKNAFLRTFQMQLQIIYKI